MQICKLCHRRSGSAFYCIISGFELYISDIDMILYDDEGVHIDHSDHLRHPVGLVGVVAFLLKKSIAFGHCFP